MTVQDRYVVVEGPDDAEALRALIYDGALGEARRLPTRTGAPRGCFAVEFDRVRVSVEVSGGGKSNLARRAIQLCEGSASRRPDAVAICFDPDTDAPDVEWRFFEHDWKREGERERKAGPLVHQRGAWWAKIRGRDVRILPAPWRSGADAMFDGLPDDHCLERVMITGLTRTSIENRVAKWVEDATRDLVALVPEHGCKRAFRLWNAALHPDVESLVAKLLQNSTTRGPCEDSIRETVAWKVMVELVS